MIGSLRGTLLEWGPGGEVLIEVAGVGYRVAVTPRTLAGLGDPGTEVFVYVHHHLREDASQLYGFATGAERATFDALLRANGVGPALALAISAVHEPEALRAAVAAGDVDAFCMVPGVGKKTAARLLIELKSRLDVPEADPVAVATADARDGVGAAGSATAAVREALAGLGYSPEEVRAALADVATPERTDASALLRDALSRLAVTRA